MKNKIPFLLFFLLTFNAFGQITNNGKSITSNLSSKNLVVKSKGKIITLNQNEIIQVYLKDSEEKIKGDFSVLNDSTIKISAKVIQLSNIEKIRARVNTRKKGLVLGAVSATLIMTSVLGFNSMSNSTDFFYQIISGFASVVVGTAGVILAPIAIANTSNSTHAYYNAKKWTYSIE